jgi:succinoglycan biosynthesis transport protein ExoP
MTSERAEALPADGGARPTGLPAFQPAAEKGLTEALITIRKRKWIIIIATLLGFAYGWYKSSIQPHVYVAMGTIEIRTGSSNAFRVSAAGGADPGVGLGNQMALLKSDTLLLMVARDLDLANNRTFLDAKRPIPHMSVEDPFIRQLMINILSGDIGVYGVTKTDLIHISCSTLDPKLSALIVNKLIDDFIYRSLQASADASERVANFLSAQLGTLKKQVEDSQARVIELGNRIGVVGLDPTHNEISTNLDALAAAASEAEIARILAESRYKILSAMDPNDLDPSVDAGKGGAGSMSALPTLRAQREGIRVQLATLSVNLGPLHPQIKALRAEDAQLSKEIDADQKQMLLSAREDFNAARTNEDRTRGALEAEKAEAYKLRGSLVEYTLKQRDFESARNLYESLLERLQTARVQAGLESTEIDIVDQATPPLGPTLQSRSSIVSLDTVVMLIAGILLAFVVDSLDTGIQTVAELEAAAGLPSLALIPRARRITDPTGLSQAQRNLAVLSSPKSQFTEAFRSLRTSLLLSTPGGEPKVILLTSATPSEGKTTAAINLACVLAQRGVRVLLIDADLRRPTVHHRFGINGKTGLTTVLSGASTLEETVQKIVEVPTLDILVSGPVPPFPTDMLGSATMHRLLQQARGIYTHIVMDSPPLLSVTDSVVLAREADTVIMIVRHGKSSKHAVRRGRELLSRAGARVTGVALNAVDLNSPEYYSYYGYSGYTSYGAGGVDKSAWDTQSSAQKSDTPGDPR